MDSGFRSITYDQVSLYNLSVQLRLGNWISSYIMYMDDFTAPTPKEIHKVRVDAKLLAFIADNPLCTYQPIPLTPVIAVNAGFKDLKTEGCDTFKRGRMLLEFAPDGNIDARLCIYDEVPYGGVDYNVLLRKIAMVHELQNLWYILMTEELPIMFSSVEIPYK